MVPSLGERWQVFIQYHDNLSLQLAELHSYPNHCYLSFVQLCVGHHHGLGLAQGQVMVER